MKICIIHQSFAYYIWRPRHGRLEYVHQIASGLRNHMDKVSRWCWIQHIQLNKSKTEIVLFGKTAELKKTLHANQQTPLNLSIIQPAIVAPSFGIPTFWAVDSWLRWSEGPHLFLSHPATMSMCSINCQLAHKIIYQSVFILMLSRYVYWNVMSTAMLCWFSFQQTVSTSHPLQLKFGFNFETLHFLVDLNFGVTGTG